MCFTYAYTPKWMNLCLCFVVSLYAKQYKCNDENNILLSRRENPELWNNALNQSTVDNQKLLIFFFSLGLQP